MISFSGNARRYSVPFAVRGTVWVFTRLEWHSSDIPEILRPDITKTFAEWTYRQSHCSAAVILNAKVGVVWQILHPLCEKQLTHSQNRIYDRLKRALLFRLPRCVSCPDVQAALMCKPPSSPGHNDRGATFPATQPRRLVSGLAGKHRTRSLLC